ncbi:Arylsulfatase [Pirellula sp. SH-Sr6A]|uniref:arylsulfatase n=1 Tax=Pirellula sp. SH-Sr6A TaxID=1632865 RepID=UPI00078C8C79|nr:arylsulfatase [Pirellula sp. SH-Sr6A]AMV32296.1 Arylsulfatase [Pirellula sp. SH-Sr6A]
MKTRHFCSTLESHRVRFVFTALLLLFGLVSGGRHLEANEGRPNVLILFADDLGYSDVGCFGGEIETPNLDRLARNGLRYNQFYNTARCWPSRAALLTGYYAQQVRRDALPGLGGGGNGVRPPWARLLPDYLQSANYRSYHSGKWHIDGKVLPSGFHRSLNMVNQGNFFSNKGNTIDDSPVTTPSGPDYYSTDATADHAIECLRDHASHHRDAPFFSYVAFISPHFPLHARPEDIARYKDRYLKGWDKLRTERWERMRSMGITSTTLSPLEREVGPPYAFPEAMKKLGDSEVNRPVPWNELNDSQKFFQATKMAIHAAMVDRMDQAIGRILKQLEEMDALDNTLVLFCSDNGASAEIMVRDGGHDPAAPMGSEKSYLSLGPGFSSAANTPHRRHKTWVHEGGISTPFIVHWPKGIQAKGEIRTTPGHLIDVVPTVLEIAGVEKPKEWEGLQLPAAPGVSLAPSFQRDGAVERSSLWWLHEGNRALRVGDWKIVAEKDRPWELYNLRNDRAEQDNLAESDPKRVEEMAAVWQGQTDAFCELVKPYATEPARPQARNKNQPMPTK